MGHGGDDAASGGGGGHDGGRRKDRGFRRVRLRADDEDRRSAARRELLTASGRFLSREEPEREVAERWGGTHLLDDDRYHVRSLQGPDRPLLGRSGS
ncbi:MAG: hypothetical protein AVDCRST_MAG19-1481 [uncultured Thermomicrobiales bacterium]|uniref:Uncharacterized protein n=1 Tax=uncultured Thermomicrobiales bacterium TaxID=1645740 RepID=A0A6J4UT19_9BACT|nr:MAG: hypothetical protein AVDCRST_MAG19-1481 [uncultured Thermomicrobiales bacterium]